MCAAFVVMATGITQAAADNDIAFSFAECAGRFSAEMEHAWVLSDPRAEHYENARSGFVSLLAAVATEADAQRAMSHRIETKFAHAALLQVATFNQDGVASAAARRIATVHLGQCEMFLLGAT